MQGNLPQNNSGPHCLLLGGVDTGHGQCGVGVGGGPPDPHPPLHYAVVVEWRLVVVRMASERIFPLGAFFVATLLGFCYIREAFDA